MSKLLITRGLPASGKSTWAETLLGVALGAMDKTHTPDEYKWVRINRDDIRKMAHNSAFIPGVTEDVIIAMRDSMIRAALRKGWNVINDDTNLKMRVARDLHKIAREEGVEFEINDSFLEVDVEECIRRDHHRGLDDPLGINKYVGEDVIRDMHNRYLKGRPGLPYPDLAEDDPTIFEPVDWYHHHSASNPACVIVDIDNTVAHNDGRRGWYEYDKVHLDTPKWDVIGVIELVALGGDQIVFVSGREDSCREVTAKWLETHLNIDDLHLYMRKTGDHRPDDVVKHEILMNEVVKDWWPTLVFDDRSRVVKMWRQCGLTTFQVADGDF